MIQCAENKEKMPKKQQKDSPLVAALPSNAPTSEPKPGPEKRKVNTQRIVQEINQRDKFVFVKDQGKFFRFTSPIWKPLLEIEVLQYIDTAQQGVLSPSACKQVLEKLKIVNVGDSRFDRSRSVIAYKNGVFDIDSAVSTNPSEQNPANLEAYFSPYSSMTAEEVADLWIPATINANFSVTATRNRFEKYLCSTFKGCEEQIPVVQEMLGYCLSYDYSIHAWFLLKGPGGNGKSVLLNLIKKLLAELATHLSFGNFNRFSTANLLNKLVCISEEMPKRPLDWDLLKDLTGGGHTSAEQKFGPTFSFRATAKFIASANESQIITDGSDAMWQRLVPISFPNGFRNTAEQILKYDEVLAEELDGFAYWGLVGLITLLRRKKFELPDICLEMSRQSRLENDSVRAFIQDRCILDKTCAVYSEGLYAGYQAYCQSAGIKPFASSRFQERIRALGIITGRDPSNVKPRRHYQAGISYDFNTWRAELKAAKGRYYQSVGPISAAPAGFRLIPIEMDAETGF